MIYPAIPPQTAHEWTDIRRIAIIDNQEALQAIPHTNQLKQHPIYHHEGIAYAINVCVARQGVVQRLKQAAAGLPEHLGLVVLDAWRSRQVQQALQDQVGALIAKTYPDLSLAQQQELLLQFVAPVAPDFISPHLTGGSVDVTLFECETGRFLDMGSDFDEPTPRSYTAFYESQPEHPAHENRRLLYHVMTDAGFTNLPTEWWHFDYGNPLWAHYSQQTHAIYGEAAWI